MPKSIINPKSPKGPLQLSLPDPKKHIPNHSLNRPTLIFIHSLVNKEICSFIKAYKLFFHKIIVTKYKFDKKLFKYYC